MTQTTRPVLDLETTCDCGALRIRAQGQVLSMFQCACLDCQKISGSGHSSIFLLPNDGLSVTGATKSHTRPAASGSMFTRHFCPECGTTAYAYSSRAPAFRIIPAGLFAGQNDWFTPNQLIFASRHVSWDLVADTIPHHASYRSE